MRRREFIAGLGGAAAWPLSAYGQQSERVRRVGVLAAYAEADPEGQARFQASFRGLVDLGWIEGRNLRPTVSCPSSQEGLSAWGSRARSGTSSFYPLTGGRVDRRAPQLGDQQMAAAALPPGADMVRKKAPMLGRTFRLDTSAGFGKRASMRFRATPLHDGSPAQASPRPSYERALRSADGSPASQQSCKPVPMQTRPR
jgi:hypothetical protein